MVSKADLEADLHAAMRAGDDLRKRTLRMVLSGVKLAEVEKREGLTEDEIRGIVEKEIKSRRESIADAERASRTDLVSAAEAELELLETYLPEQMKDDELETLASSAILEVGADSPQAMGSVMKILMPRVQGRADGSRVSEVVRRLLSEKT